MGLRVICVQIALWPSCGCERRLQRPRERRIRGSWGDPSSDPLGTAELHGIERFNGSQAGDAHDAQAAHMANGKAVEPVIFKYSWS